MKDLKNANLKNGPIAWMANNPVASNLLMVMLIVGGLVTLLIIRQEVFPDVELDQITISVPYPGASPEEVEQGVILAVEESVRALDGVKEVISNAREGLGTISVHLLLGSDRQRVYQDVQAAVDRITSFPQDAEEARVFFANQNQQVLTLVLYGPVDDLALRNQAERIRRQMLQDPNITQVELGAVRPYEISIEVSQDNLVAFDLTLEEIATRIKNASIELPGGRLKTTDREILVRISDRKLWGEEFADLPILATDEGSTITLGEIALIRDRFEDVDVQTSYNGFPAVRIDVFRIGKQTPVQVSEAVTLRRQVIAAELPAQIKLEILSNRADQYRSSIGVILRNGLLGLVLVFCLLGLFLEPRLAFWVGMGLPTSFLGALIILPGFDVSINTVSLFGFLVAIGIVVDDAIVVSENIFEHQDRGGSMLNSAIVGTRQVATSVTYSVLTNIVAFLPFFFVPGFLGKLLQMIPAVVILVLALSLIESFFILPAHLGHGSRSKKSLAFLRFQRRFSQWTTRMIDYWVQPGLSVAIRVRYATLAGCSAVLILAVSYLASGRVGLRLGPDTEEDQAIAHITLPFGTPLATTQRIEARLVAAANQIIQEHGGTQLAHGVYSEIGGFENGVAVGGHQLSVTAYLTAPGIRPIRTKTFCDLWQERMGSIASAESVAFLANDEGPTGDGPAINIELSHPNRETLHEAASELATMMRRLPFVSNIDDGIRLGKKQYDFQLMETGRALGITSQSLAKQVRGAFHGIEALRQQRGRHEIKVMVRRPISERLSENELEELLVRTPQGVQVPLREVAWMKTGRAFTSIDRREGHRILNVSCDVKPEPKAGQIEQQLINNLIPKLILNYPELHISFGGEQRELAESMQSLGMGLLFALLAIYSLMAIPFRSYIQPAIIMTSIPFGLIGAFAGHLIMGYQLSLVSIMGMVALVGVIVNNGLVLIAFANHQRSEGASAFEAIKSAAVRRFRPIMLTSLTTFGGLAPMIFETSEQAQLMIPIAISLGYGVLFATFTTLLTVPSLYLVIEDLRTWRNNR